MRLDGRKGIRSVKVAWSFLHTELKASVLPLLEGNNKRRKTNTHTQAKQKTKKKKTKMNRTLSVSRTCEWVKLFEWVK